jgi:hypothetical protein
MPSCDPRRACLHAKTKVALTKNKKISEDMHASKEHQDCVTCSEPRARQPADVSQYPRELARLAVIVGAQPSFLKFILVLPAPRSTTASVSSGRRPAWAHDVSKLKHTALSTTKQAACAGHRNKKSGMPSASKPFTAWARFLRADF